MKKHFFLIILCFAVCMLTAQNKNRYLKITYIAIPHSSYHRSPKVTDYEDNRAASLAAAYRYYYTLYVDLQTQRSIYQIDSLSMGKKPAGQEHVKYMVNDSLSYVVKSSPQMFFKYEELFHHPFYCEGNLKEIEWNITDKVKTIYGLHCKKAVAKNKDFLMNVWFTTDIAVSTGPGIFLNLPGLVVRSEEFFWTTEIENITYIDSEKLNFEKLIATYQKDFDRNKKGNNIKEKKLLFKKASIITSMLNAPISR